MSLFTAVKVFKIFLTFFLKILALALPFLKNSAMLLVYDVGISFSLLFKIAILSRVFLFSSTKVIIQAAGYVNQVFLNVREFLYNYRVLNLCAQAFIKLGHFNAIVLYYPRRILSEFSQVFRDRNGLY
jgi:hypothetical protein